MSEYRFDKIAHHPQVIDRLCGGGKFVPVSMQLVISDFCNHWCKFCSYRNMGPQLFAAGGVNLNPKRFLSFRFVQLLTKWSRERGLKAVEITGGGEPTMNPECVEILFYLSTIELDVGFVTNGVALSPELIECLVQPGSEKWVRISLDAATDKTHALIHQCGRSHFGEVLVNLERLVRTRANTPYSPLVIGVSFIVTTDNAGELVEAVKLARSLGVDTFRFAPEWPENGSEVFVPDEEIVRSAIDLATKDFQVVNNFSHRVEELTTRPVDRICYYQQVASYVGADQNMYRCCAHAYKTSGLLGSLDKGNFEMLWRNDRSNSLDFWAFDARECPRCPHANKNKAIAAAVKAKQHANFM